MFFVDSFEIVKICKSLERTTEFNTILLDTFEFHNFEAIKIRTFSIIS